MQLVGEHVGVRANLLLIGAEGIGGGDPEARRLGCDRVDERPALHPWEHGPVDRLGVLLAAEDEADRGPASVLCVVEVTKSQCSTGFGCSPAATRPEKWAMSHISSASTSSAIRRNSAVSTVRG